MISSTSAAKSESIDDDLCPSSHWGHHTGKVAGGFRLRDVDDIVRHSRLAMSVRVFSTPAPQCFRAGVSPCKSSSMADPAICVISDQILCIDPHDSGLQ